MKRNFDIEARIKMRRNALGYGANPYGGMGMDGNSASVIKEKQEELDYMNQHPEIYRPVRNTQTNNLDNDMYLILKK